MKHEVKTFNADVKVSSRGDKGTIEALVSVFGNVDLGGDRMVKGAFADTLAAWRDKGDPIPFIFSHQWDDPDAYLGGVTSAEETDEGLVVKAQVDLAHPPARRVFDLLKSRLITQFSFGYYARDYEVVNEEGESIRELRAVDLFEVGPTLLGMNPETALLEAASATARHAKAGRVLSAKNEQALREAKVLIDGVLGSLPAPEESASATDVQTESSEGVDTTPDEKTALNGSEGDVLTHETPEEVSETTSEVVAADDADEVNQSSVQDGEVLGDDERKIAKEQIVALLVKTRYREEK